MPEPSPKSTCHTPIVGSSGVLVPIKFTVKGDGPDVISGVSTGYCVGPAIFKDSINNLLYLSRFGENKKAPEGAFI